TNSGDFPLGSGKSGSASGADAFVSRIDTSVQSATALGHFGTLLGGSASDLSNSIATDSESNTNVYRETASTDFLKHSSLKPNLNHKMDVFVANLLHTAIMEL